MIHEGKWGARVENQACLAAMIPDKAQTAVYVPGGFGMERDDIGPRFGKHGDQAVNWFTHQVDINGRGGMRANGFANHGADGQVGDIMVVHDIKMDPVGAGLDDIANFFAQTGKIGG